MEYYLKSYLRAYKQNLIEIFIGLHIITIKLYLNNLLINIINLRRLFDFMDLRNFKLIDHSYPSHFPAVKLSQENTFTDNIQLINRR